MKTWERVGDGLYRSQYGKLYSRPVINGKRTFRKLKARTIKEAKAELAALQTEAARAAVGLGRDPYGPAPATVGKLIEAYQAAGCPTVKGGPRSGRQLILEKRRTDKLMQFWKDRPADKVKMPDMYDYWGVRRPQIKKGNGGRSVDMELWTLTTVLGFAVQRGLIDRQPFHGKRPKFRPKEIRHCRNYMPENGDVLHQIAETLFDGHYDSQALGWFVLLLAMTGCRKSEVLNMRWDATNRRQPGFIEGDWLWVSRAKGGVNPFVQIHPDLRQLLDNMQVWRSTLKEPTPWFIPGRNLNKSANEQALNNALERVTELLKVPHCTPHGLRAYYVTLRRSAGISDAQIAAEIGDASGAAIITATYGGIPPNWAQTGAPKLRWMPSYGEPAWAALKLPENLVPLAHAAES